MPRLGICARAGIDPLSLGADLRALEASPLEHEAVLLTAPITGAAIALGALQVAASSIDVPLSRLNCVVIARRAAGGPAIAVAPGQLYLALHLRSPAALGGVVDPSRLLNRQVRPLLRAITESTGIPASSGGRDLILARGAVVAWIGVRHRARDGRCAIEAVIAVEKTLALDDALDLAAGSIAPRWLGKPVTPLRELAPSASIESLAAAVARSYAAAAGDAEAIELPPPLASHVDDEERPFDALIEEASGLVGARIDRERVTIGGELYASHDALNALGVSLHTAGPRVSELALAEHMERAIGTGSGALLLGVRSLESIAKVVRAAWAARELM